MIAMYDLEDNIITIFDNYKECAKYFNTSTGVLRSYICRNKKGKIDKKRWISRESRGGLDYEKNINE